MDEMKPSDEVHARMQGEIFASIPLARGRERRLSELLTRCRLWLKAGQEHTDEHAMEAHVLCQNIDAALAPPPASERERRLEAALLQAIPWIGHGKNEPSWATPEAAQRNREMCEKAFNDATDCFPDQESIENARSAALAPAAGPPLPLALRDNQITEGDANKLFNKALEMENADLRRKVEEMTAQRDASLVDAEGNWDMFKQWRTLAERLAGACEAVLCNCEDCRDDTMICDTCQKRFAALADYRAAVKESGT